MTRQVFVQAEFSPERAAALDPRLVNLATQRGPWEVRDSIDVCWVLGPNEFHLAPFLRCAIPKAGPISWSVVGRNIGDKDPVDAALVQLMPDQLKDVVEPGPTLTPNVWCDVCRRPTTRLVENPVLRARFPPPLTVPALFYPTKNFVRVMSGELLSMLRDRDLAKGLETFPVEIEGPTDDDYFGLFSSHVLETAMPYGCIVPSDPCPKCGMGGARHAFYEAFLKPATEVYWYTDTPRGKSLIVTHRVYHWLRTEGAKHVGKPFRGREPQGIRMGWYPDDKDRAFLPERFQGISEEPVEPIRPDELERLMSPAVTLGKVTKSRARKSSK